MCVGKINMNPNKAHSSQDELIDLVDFNDSVIGKERRSSIIEKGLCNYRVINAFIINNEGKLWIPRRTHDKVLFPYGLDVSVGGFVASGECYEAAMSRELKEEVTIELNSVSYQLLGYLSPYKHNVSSFMKVYEVRYDNSPRYNPKDFVEAYWLTVEELMSKIAEEAYTPNSDLLKLIRIFYL